MLDMILNEKLKEAKDKKSICRSAQKYLQRFLLRIVKLYHCLGIFDNAIEARTNNR